MNLVQRSIQSSTYNLLSSLIQTVILLARSILLARLLDPEVFGIYSYAISLIVLTRALQIFGLNNAYIHHTKESEGELSLRVYFSLSIFFCIIWTVLIILVSTFLVPINDRWVLYVLVVTEWIDSLVRIGRVILIKQVSFKRLSIIETLITILATISALSFAAMGYGIWSLLSTDIIAGSVAFICIYVYRPIWLPKIGWDRNIAKYYMNFGFKSFLSDLLGSAVNEIDDIWTGRILGDLALGFYSRAYAFATYPRKILATPFNQVSAGTYAEVKNDTKRLSQAFFRVNALLIRVGFFSAGLLVLIAPELVRIILGDKWIPMISTFRFMLIFTLLEPIRMTISNLFNALGYPEKSVKINLLQLITLVICLFLFAKNFGIEGVAISVNIMAVVGVTYMFLLAKQHVKFSIIRLFLVPVVSILLGIIYGRLAIELPGIQGSLWRTGIVKAIVFSLLYIGILFILERKQIPRFVNIFFKAWNINKQL